MFTLNPRLAADVFDGEYIIANLDTGMYYSVQGIAVSLINALPFDDYHEVIQSLADAIPQYTNAIQSELPPIFRQLLDEDIIRETDATEVTVIGTVDAPATYEPPRFNRYADMQDLLMLDPIHDVDEEGWSVQKEA